ncbi:MAG: hypothetical protein FWG51_00585 [Firmicutes bacterium]|nr:hypothetical protein [Bacillota bacterium]
MNNPKFNDKVLISKKKFHWRWLILNLCCEREIVNFYEVENINNMGDVVLFTQFRNRKKFPQHVILIKRTSEKCYRLTALIFNDMFYESFSDVSGIINYIKRLIKKFSAPVIEK